MGILLPESLSFSSLLQLGLDESSSISLLWLFTPVYFGLFTQELGLDYTMTTHWGPLLGCDRAVPDSNPAPTPPNPRS